MARPGFAFSLAVELKNFLDPSHAVIEFVEDEVEQGDVAEIQILADSLLDESGGLFDRAKRFDLVGLRTEH